MTEWIVTSSAMILIVIALRGLLKGKISLKLQYGLWALVLIRLLLPFSIVDSAISISNLLSAPVIREADEAVTDYETAYQRAVQRHESSGTEYTDTEIRQQVQQELYDREYSRIEKEYAQTGAAVPQIQIQTEAQQQVEVISVTAVITEALPYFWVEGMIAVAAALIGSNIHFWWKLRQSRKPLDIPGVPLRVYLTDYVATPCLFGAVKPDIYLTGEVMTDSKMRHHVIAHEMSHYRQGDHIWSVLRCVCLVLHWYNPLVWAAAILSKQDAELACDEATIKALGEAERVAYGRTLIGMTCVRRDPSSLMLTATTMLGTKKTLKERIALIAKKPKTALYTLIACILVVSLAVGCTFTGAPGEPAEEKDEIWEQVQSAVDTCNNSRSLHMSSYTCSGDIHQIDFEETPKGFECWIYEDTYYSELNGEDGPTPNHLMHNGVLYNHRLDNEWLLFGNYEGEFYSYIDLPRDKNSVIDWTETDDRLEVIMESGDITTTVWMDINGKLLLYGVTDENMEQHFIYLYHDTPEQEIRQKVESVVSNMEIIEREDILTAQEVLLLDRCQDAVAYIQNLEHFEITEHYEVVEESDYVLAPNFVEARYVHSGDDWYHNRVTPDWTWQFLEKDGEQFRKDITNAVPEEDIPAIEWIRADLSENNYAQHAWIMDIYWRNETIGFLTYTGNGNGYEGGSLTPLSVTYDTEGSFELISVEFEPGTEQIYNSEDQEGIRWILTFRFDLYSGDVVEAKREIVAEDREVHVAGINGGTEYIDFRSTSTLSIYPGTEEEMSAIIDGIYYDEIVTVVSTPDDPTEPSTELTEPPTEPTTEPTAPLSMEEQFQQMLTYENGYWYWRAMGCVFEKPEDIDMSLLCYRGMENGQLSSTFTDDEIAFLKTQNLGIAGDDSAWSNAHKLPRQELDAALQAYFGVTLDDVTIPTGWVYYSETDAYYHVKYDSYGLREYTVTDVEYHDDGTVSVYWFVPFGLWDTRNQDDATFLSDVDMLLTLKANDDGTYTVLSNLPVEE